MHASKVVIFGNGTFASLAWSCLTHDSPWQVAAFTADRDFIKETTHEGLPVVPFDALPTLFPPHDFKISIPLGCVNINGLRLERYLQAKSMGYQFISYVSSRATTWPNVQIGENCFIYDHAILEPFSRVGDNVIIRAAALISHHGVIGSHSMLSGGVVLGGNVHIGERVFVGLGAVVRNGLRLAERSFIGAGAVVIADTEADGVYVGNPARKTARTSMQVSAA
ncbi:MAG: acetyltransferase [Magnetococcus sp. DMHC-1]|nr:acetyltransferase [Magnetococcales bacterium]